MPTRPLFSTRFYEGELGDPVLIAELEESCRALADEDGAGRRWSSEHGYRGYTSYASLNDLPARDPRFAELVRHLNRHVAAFAADCAFDLGGRRLKLDSLWVNVLRPGGGHSGHIHPHSVVSGTLYVAVPPGSGRAEARGSAAADDDGGAAATGRRAGGAEDLRLCRAGAGASVPVGELASPRGRARPLERRADQHQLQLPAVTGPVAGPCDGAIAAVARARPCPSQRWTLVASILASSLSFVDGSVVNVALPAIGASLQAEASGLQWIVNAYLLPLSALLLLGGAAGDKFGRRRLFLLGIALFAIASALCALAPSLELLLAGRALQGIASAMLMPNSLALLGSAFAGEARGRAIGTWAAAGAVAGAIGPLLGGWLVDSVGWRSIFLINLPLCAAALWLGWRFVAESREEGGAPLDGLGVAVATLGLGAVTWGLTELSGGAGGDRGWIAAGAGAAALLAFVAIERKRGERAIMPLALFGTASFAGLTLLTFFLYAALGGLFVALPFVLIELRGYSPVAAGAALLPLPVVIALGSRLMGRVAARTGPRLPLTVGPLIVGGRLRARGRGSATGDSYWTSVLPADAGDRDRHGRGGRAADHGGDGLGRQGPCRHRQRLQQRGGAHRRADRHRPARLGAGGPGGGAGRRFCHGGLCRRGGRGRGRPGGAAPAAAEGDQDAESELRPNPRSG